MVQETNGLNIQKPRGENRPPTWMNLASVLISTLTLGISYYSYNYCDRICSDARQSISRAKQAIDEARHSQSQYLLVISCHKARTYGEAIDVLCPTGQREIVPEDRPYIIDDIFIKDANSQIVLFSARSQFQDSLVQRGQLYGLDSSTLSGLVGNMSILLKEEK